MPLKNPVDSGKGQSDLSMTNIVQSQALLPREYIKPSKYFLHRKKLECSTWLDWFGFAWPQRQHFSSSSLQYTAIDLISTVW